MKSIMDPISDYHFLNGILGKTVKVTLKCATFQGVLQHVDSSRSIFLNRVKNLEIGTHVPGVKMFFGHEIVNVELLDDLKQHAAEEKAIPTREVPTAVPSVIGRGEPLKQNIEGLNAVSQERQQLSLDNIKCFFPERDQEQDIKYVVIDQFQKNFGSAMMHIKKQNVCGIAAEGVNLCRHGKLSWLQVATTSHIFLFDIFLLGVRVFKNGLQMVLEDRNILKVIHDCRWLSDCLSHQYGIVLSNVFDTQVADVLHFSMETGGFLPHCISTLQECLMRHFRMPYKFISFLEQRRCAVENAEVWFVRPLPPVLLNVLALETVYLLPLRTLLLDGIMSDLTTLVDGYLNAFREGSADPLGSTEISCMELPQELRQLTDVYKDRRERALQKFHLNEEGLLIRIPTEHLGKKTAEKEGNSIGSIPPNKAAFPKKSYANFVSLWDLVQDISERVENK
ncbi:piRNA biogenesis protein EXD1 isoform X2 [Tiliqua scincoides]|uniref:piRNA biogenesis protein EXD1 isoform X2 n=1 Tax=Tiliqua scincoides TaxID=71010 RepID=UPI0034620CF1